MIDIAFLIKGVLVGFLASIPLGPIGILCIQRTLSKRFKSGLVSGFGAATADTVFAILAIFFLSIVTSFIEERLKMLTVVGGVIIMYIGVNIYMKKISPVSLRKNRAKSDKYFKDYISTFLLTLTNPAFIFVFVGLFASFEINNSDLNVPNALITVLGVTTGSSLWWLSLTSLVNKFKKRFRPRHLIIINKIAGAVIFALGLIATVGAFFETKINGLDNIIK